MIGVRDNRLTDDSTDEYIDKVVKRYSKLFGLPSQRRITFYLGVLSLHGGILSFLSLGLSLENFALGLDFSVIFFFLTILSDYTIIRSSMKRDLIFNLRRVSALSLFSSLVWFGVLLVGGLTSAFFGAPELWIRFFFLGFSGALILRLLVLSVTSFASFGDTLFSSLLQPTLVAVPILFFGPRIGFDLEVQLLFIVSTSVIVALLTVVAFKYFMDRIGKGTLGVASSVLFKAFLANWTEDLIHPLEAFFEKLGNDQDIKVSLLTFKADKKVKAVVVVPALHPGPFKNLGSSLLPSLIQNTLEDKFNCVVSVPHGLVGHELDLSSQYQNQKVLKSIVGFVDSSSSHSEATPFVRTENYEAKASCQVFGDCALLTLTTAPRTMEDLPQELNSFIVGEAEKHGLSALAIDAHNSMDGTFDLNKAIKPLEEAAVGSLKKALNLRCSSFKVGAATVIPEEFTLQDGMGPGGVSVIVIEVGNQKTAYVTIDGNNMVSGLRERILSDLKTLGIADGEVLTTDTHSVCGMVRSRRGYNLVGEAVDHSKLISYIREATKSALDSLEPAEVSWRTEMIPAVRVIGEQQISEIMILADKTTQRARRLAVSLFPTSALLLILLLLFLL
jgi:putative membrane protein